jgi:hypothetical protein
MAEDQVHTLTIEERILDVNSKVSPVILGGLVGKNHSQIYAWSQDGRLPHPLSNYNYVECLKHLVNSLLKAEEVKKLKLEANLRLQEEQRQRREEERSSKQNTTKFTAYADDGEMHPLMQDKIRMAVRKDHAVTAQTWQKVAIERGDYIAAREMEELVKPFILTIRDSLNSIILDFPETQEKIDGVLDNLYTIGVQLLEGSDRDKESFIETILETPIDDLQEAI